MEIVVALDVTDFDGDGGSTIALSLVTAHRRATPLVWMRVKKAQLRGRRNRYDDIRPGSGPAPGRPDTEGVAVAWPPIGRTRSSPAGDR